MLKTPNPTAGMRFPSFSGIEGLEELAMTRSLPGAPDLQLKPSSGWSGRLQSIAGKVAVKVLPWVPSRVVRLLAGGRSVTIDGNTLDPILQLMLSGQRAVGVDGLAAADDVAASRALMRAGEPGKALPHQIGRAHV